MNILQALGGVGSGLMLAQKVNAEQEEIKRRKKDQEWQDKERGRRERDWEKQDGYEAADKALIEEDRKSRSQDKNLAASAGTAANLAAQMAAGGVDIPSAIPQTQVAPRTFAESAAQGQAAGIPQAPQRQTSPMVAQRGIPSEIASPSQKQADPLDIIARRRDLAIEHGQWDKATQFGQIRLGAMQEKVIAETKQRKDAATSMISALSSGDDARLMSAAKQLSDLLPDGNDINGIRRVKGGYAVKYGNNPEQVLSTDQIQQLAMSMISPEAVLNLIHQSDTRDIQQKRLALVQAQEGRQSGKYADDKADRAQSKADALAKVKAKVAYFKAKNPDASQADIDAVENDVIQAVKKETADKYDAKVDRFGNSVTVVNTGTGETNIHDVRKGTNVRIPAPGSAPAPKPTRDQIKAAAAAKGITDPKELDKLYAGYGV